MSLTTCPSTVPLYYTVVIHVVAALSIPANFIVFYLIVYHSQKMQTYKYCIFYMQFSCFLSEFYASIVSTAYYFFPLVGGINIGSKFEFAAHYRMVVWLFLFSFELPSMLWCFIYRNSAAEDIQRISRRRHFKKGWLIMTHIFPFFVAISFGLSRLTYQQKHDYLKNNWPECMEWMKFANFEAYDYNANSWLAVAGLGALSVIFLVYVYTFYLGVNTMLILQSFRKSMSPQTYQMHKAALFSLVMQLVVPGVLLIIPLGVCLFVVITRAVELHGFAANTNCFFLSHSLCLCVVMILSNANYRKVLKEKFRARLCGRRAKVDHRVSVGIVVTEMVQSVN